MEAYIDAGRPGIAAYLREPLLAGGETFERTRRMLFDLAHDDDDAGERADRALLELCGPYVPQAVYRVVRAFSINLTAIIYSRHDADRVRIARLLRDLIEEALKVQEKGRAA